MGETALLTDSCCDLPLEIVEAAGIEYVNFSWILDGAEHPDDLGQTMSHDDFYAMLESGAVVKTAMVPVADYLAAFERLTAGGRPVVYIAFSSALSGSFDVSLTAREQFLAEHPDAEIYCVDSKCASTGQGLVVLGAAELVRQGASAEEVVRWAEENRLRVNHTFTVDSFEHLVRGGRVSPAVGKVGSVLNIKPVMRVDATGALEVVKKPRGRHIAIETIVEMVAERVGDPNWVVFISHGDCAKDAETLRSLLVERCGLTNARIGRVGTAIGAHTGPGVLCAFFWGEARE